MPLLYLPTYLITNMSPFSIQTYHSEHTKYLVDYIHSNYIYIMYSSFRSDGNKKVLP